MARLVVALAVGLAAAASDLYVSTAGSDSDDGSADAPFRTIQHCHDVAAGATCHVSAGTYRETVTVASDASIKGEVGAIVSGLDVLDGLEWTQDAQECVGARVDARAWFASPPRPVNDPRRSTARRSRARTSASSSTAAV